MTPTRLLLPGVVLAAAGLSFLRDLPSQEYHGDETYWIRRGMPSRLFADDFVKRDRHWSSWGTTYNPVPLGKLALLSGAVLFGADVARLERLPEWRWGRDRAWNLARAVPHPRDLLAARAGMALLGVLACLVLQEFARRAWGETAGLLAGLLAAANPLMRDSCRRAMLDAPLILLLVSSGVLLLQYHRAVSARRARAAVLWAAGAGAAAAAAAAVKLNGGLAAVAFLALWTLCALTRDGEGRAHAWSLAAFSATAAAAFVALNPLLWVDPATRTLDMLRHYDALLERCQLLYGPAVTSLPERAGLVARRVLWPGSYATTGMTALLFPAGLLVLLRAEAASLRTTGRPTPSAAALVWVIVVCAGITAWLPLDWDRYYLPVAIAVTLVSARALDLGVRRLVSLAAARPAASR